MELRPILSTLLRHKTAASLIVLQIALSCAIICNAFFLIGERVDRLRLVSGVAENEVVRVQLTGIGEDADAEALTRSDLALLRGLPGVDLVASFGATLHASGKDRAQLEASLRAHLQGNGLKLTAVSASLEDAFIYLMQGSQDQFRG